jgi:hypothetical protein
LEVLEGSILKDVEIYLIYIQEREEKNVTSPVDLPRDSKVGEKSRRHETVKSLERNLPFPLSPIPSLSSDHRYCYTATPTAPLLAHFYQLDHSLPFCYLLYPARDMVIRQITSASI